MSQPNPVQNHPQTNVEKKEYTYVILQETDGNECESWYYFLRREGNEENLAFLNKQIDSVKWTADEGFNAFDLDLEHPVCERTAKEMINVELNVYFHRKFDGVLKKIDFEFAEKEKNSRKMKKVNKLIGGGRIDRFIDCEDVDPNDLNNSSDESDESGDESTTSSISSNSPPPKKKEKKIPKALVDIPRFAKIKQRHN